MPKKHRIRENKILTELTTECNNQDFSSKFVPNTFIYLEFKL